VLAGLDPREGVGSCLLVEFNSPALRQFILTAIGVRFPKFASSSLDKSLPDPIGPIAGASTLDGVRGSLLDELLLSS
jgi:hypothetical protein